MKLSESEKEALFLLRRSGGSILISQIPDTTQKDHMGEVTPGMSIYKKLEKKGLCFQTEEEPIDLGDGTMFDFTPSIELTDEGKALVSEIH